MPPRCLFLICLALWTLSGLVATRLAVAHDPFELTTTGRISARELTFVTTMTRACALALIEPERRPFTAFPPEELPKHSPRLEIAGASLFALTHAGRRLSPNQVRVGLGREAEVELTVVFPAPPPGALRIEAPHVRKLGAGYTSALTLAQDAPAKVLGIALFKEDSFELTVDVLAPNAGGTGPTPGGEAAVAPSFLAMVRLGVEHILMGYDHLLFLTALLAACRSFRAMLGIVTAFTAAHSITLALSALDYVSFPSRVVESLIAGSIVLVGIENLLRREAPPARPAICFAFGLVHGLGFAGALREVGLGEQGAPMVVPLLGFNMGVEVGQLLVVAVLLPSLLLLRRKPAIARIALPLVSLSVVLAGTYWLVERAAA